MDRTEEIYSLVDNTKLGTNAEEVTHKLKSGESFNLSSIDSDDKMLQTEQIIESEPIYVPEPIDLRNLNEAYDQSIESEPVYPYGMKHVNLEPTKWEPLSCLPEAQKLAHFCETTLSRLESCSSKTEEWQAITSEYNQGSLNPELLKLKGKRSERALRHWVEKYLDAKRDMFALIHKGKHQPRGRKVTYVEQNFLLNTLLTPHQVKVGSAVATLKSYARLGMLESPSSVPTLKRWCDDWERDNRAIWTQARFGSKRVAEHIVKTIMRDNSQLEVGSVWVADGHTLSFDIMNPKTGKSQRMTMIMVFDWASRYPVGASLAYTEDSQHIQIAFRNAFLNYGGVPKYVYLDNGKAFKSKLFNERWEAHDLQTELGGIFPRLEVQVAFAESYNAKAKIIERFFKTFQERFERFISSFRGASVADKPATLMRNEKWAKKLFEVQPPTLEEAMQMIAYFIRHMYGETPHNGLNGMTPWDVYNGNPCPQERKVEASKLNFLMLSTVRKTLRNNGIMLNKLMYWDVALIGHIGKEILIRYDLADARWILVYDLQDNFICQAEVRRAQDPFIHLDTSNPISQSELSKEYKANKRHQKTIEQRTKQVVRHTQEVVDAYVKPLQISKDEPNPTFIQPPMITPPEPSTDQLIETLEKQVMQSQPKLELPEVVRPEAKPEHIVNFTPNPVTETDEDEIKPKAKSFEEMLAFIGIK
jgi:putative transposase